MRSATDLLDELNAVDESARIEAKRASDIGKSVMETVIAFSNEPGLDGGYLLLGVDWAINDKGDTVYRPVGCPIRTRCSVISLANVPVCSTLRCGQRCN